MLLFWDLRSTATLFSSGKCYLFCSCVEGSSIYTGFSWGGRIFRWRLGWFWWIWAVGARVGRGWSLSSLDGTECSGILRDTFLSYSWRQWEHCCPKEACGFPHIFDEYISWGSSLRLHILISDNWFQVTLMTRSCKCWITLPKYLHSRLE